MTLRELLGRSATTLGIRTTRATGHLVPGAAGVAGAAGVPRAAGGARAAAERPLRKACARPMRPAAAPGQSGAPAFPHRNYLLIGAALAAVITLPVFLSQVSGAATSPGATVPTAVPASALPTALSGTSAASAIAGATPGVAGLGLTDGIDLFDLAAKTLLVLGLLYLTLRVLRRMQGGSQPHGDGIAVLESRAIAPKTSVLVVSVRGRELVLGLSPAGLTTLADLAPRQFARSDVHRPDDVPEPGLETDRAVVAGRRDILEGVPQRPSIRRVRGRAA